MRPRLLATETRPAPLLETPMRLALTTLLAALLLTPLPARAAEVAGVHLDDQITLAGSTEPLKLNGAGVRKKFFLKIYVAALYLPAPARDAEAVATMAGRKRVVMHFLYHKVGRDKLTEGWEEGFDHNLDTATRRAMAARLADFTRLFPDLHRDDTVDLDLIPGTGTEVRINGRLAGTIPGDDFYRALLRVWLGPKPADRDLKRALLGG